MCHLRVPLSGNKHADPIINGPIFCHMAPSTRVHFHFFAPRNNILERMPRSKQPAPTRNAAHPKRPSPGEKLNTAASEAFTTMQKYFVSVSRGPRTVCWSVTPNRADWAKGIAALLDIPLNYTFVDFFATNGAIVAALKAIRRQQRVYMVYHHASHSSDVNTAIGLVTPNDNRSIEWMRRIWEFATSMHSSALHQLSRDPMEPPTETERRTFLSYSPPYDLVQICRQIEICNATGGEPGRRTVSDKAKPFSVPPMMTGMEFPLEKIEVITLSGQRVYEAPENKKPPLFGWFDFGTGETVAEFITSLPGEVNPCKIMKDLIDSVWRAGPNEPWIAVVTPTQKHNFDYWYHALAGIMPKLLILHTTSGRHKAFMIYWESKPGLLDWSLPQSLDTSLERELDAASSEPSSSSISNITPSSAPEASSSLLASTS